MVHVSGDGQVVSSRPWSITRLIGEIFNAISLFFTTLISPASDRYSTGNYSRGSASGSSSGPRPGGPRRPIGRINFDVPVPGCRSCQG